MKTLKKTLCLVLAVVMVVGVLVIPATAADFTDKADIKHETAVNVLKMVGILNGKDNGSFAPKDTLTRAEAAKMVAYALLGEKSEDLTSNAQKFSDVPTTNWANGYIAYANDKGIIAGKGDGTFAPNDKVTGHELARMLLVAIGLKGVYTGDTWVNGVVENANYAKLYASIDSTVDMTKAITRDDAAQMVFNAIMWQSSSSVWWRVYADADGDKTFDTTETVYYYGPSEAIAAAYASRIPSTESEKVSYPNKSLGESVFGLTSAAGYDVHGRPQTVYTSVVPDDDYTAKVTPAATYTVATAECDIASALGLTKNKNYPITVYENGVKTETKIEINPTDTVQQHGAQGRTIEVYPNAAAPEKGTLAIYDTYYAVVTTTVSKLTDAAGHTINDAKANITVYFADGTSKAASISNADGKYKKDDKLSVHYLLNDKGTYVADDVNILAPKTVTVAAINTGTPTGTTQNYVGIRDTAGNSYKYNCTYNGTKLENKDLGTTVDLYLDSNGNILFIKPASSSSVGGLVTGIDSVKIGTGKYAAEVEYLDADSKVQVINVLKDADTSYGSAAEAVDADDGAGKYLDHLVAFTADADYPGYYVASTIGKGVSTINHIFAGDANALSTIIETTTTGSTTESTPVEVNDKSVFYVANYGTNNKTNGYKFTSYNVTTGFKSINDMFSKSGLNIDVNGETVTTTSNLNVETITVGSKRLVLVKEALIKKANYAHGVSNYAYLLTNKDFVDTYNEYRNYNAIINGTKQTLQVTAASVGSINEMGLYTYTNNGGYTTINENTGYEQTIGAGEYKLSDSVLTYTGSSSGVVYAQNYDQELGGTGTDGQLVSKSASTIKKLTVADDVKVYLVNPNSGDVVPAVTDLLSTAPYKDKCAIWYQLDEYGYVDLIYIINYDLPNDATGTPITAVTVTMTGGAAYTVVGDTKFTVSSATPTIGGTIKVEATQWYRIEANGTVTPISDSTLFMPNTNYKVDLKLTLTNSSSENYALTGACTLSVSGIGASGTLTDGVGSLLFINTRAN